MSRYHAIMAIDTVEQQSGHRMATLVDEIRRDGLAQVTLKYSLSVAVLHTAVAAFYNWSDVG